MNRNLGRIFFFLCPELQGCYTQDDTYEQVSENMKDVVQLHFEDGLEVGEEINSSVLSA